MQIDAKMGVGLAILPAASSAPESRGEPDGGFERELNAKTRPKEESVQPDRKPEKNSDIEERKETQPNAESNTKKPDLEKPDSPNSKSETEEKVLTDSSDKSDEHETTGLPPVFLMPLALPTLETAVVTDTTTETPAVEITNVVASTQAVAENADSESDLPEGMTAVKPEAVDPALASQIQDRKGGGGEKESKEGRTDNPKSIQAPTDKVLSDEIVDALNPVYVDPNKIHISKDLKMGSGNQQQPGVRTPVHQAVDNSGLNSSNFQPKQDMRHRLFDAGKNMGEGKMKGGVVGTGAATDAATILEMPEIVTEEKTIGTSFGGGDVQSGQISGGEVLSNGGGTSDDSESGLTDGLFEELVTNAEGSNSDVKSGQPVLDTHKTVSATRTAAPEAPQDPKLQEQIVKQVADRLDQVLSSRRNGSIVVHLEPRELGQITVNIRQFGTRIDAEITTSNAQVRENLESGRQQLVQQVEAKGLSLGSLNVNSQDAGMNGGRNPQENLQRDDFERMRNMSEVFGDSTQPRITPNIGIRPGSDWGMDLLI